MSQVVDEVLAANKIRAWPKLFTAFTELRGGASFCSTAAAGSSAGDLSGSTEGGAGDILSNSTAAAAGCASFGSTVGGLADLTVVSGAGDVLFGSTAVPADCASFSSTAGALSGSTGEEGAGDIVFGSTAAAAGCASFGSTAAAGSSAGVFVSCGGRDRGSGGDDTNRWRRAPDPVTWWNQVITLCAILESDGKSFRRCRWLLSLRWGRRSSQQLQRQKEYCRP